VAAMLNSLKQTSKDFLRLLLETANMRSTPFHKYGDVFLGDS
jgi:hypothetical protein